MADNSYKRRCPFSDLHTKVYPSAINKHRTTVSRESGDAQCLKSANTLMYKQIHLSDESGCERDSAVFKKPDLIRHPQLAKSLAEELVRKSNDMSKFDQVAMSVWSEDSAQIGGGIGDTFYKVLRAKCPQEKNMHLLLDEVVDLRRDLKKQLRDLAIFKAEIRQSSQQTVFQLDSEEGFRNTHQPVEDISSTENTKYMVDSLQDCTSEESSQMITANEESTRSFFISKADVSSSKTNMAVVVSGYTLGKKMKVSSDSDDSDDSQIFSSAENTQVLCGFRQILPPQDDSVEVHFTCATLDTESSQSNDVCIIQY